MRSICTLESAGSQRIGMSVAAMGFSPLHRPPFMGGNVALGCVRFLGDADAAPAETESPDGRDESERNVKFRKPWRVKRGCET